MVGIDVLIVGLLIGCALYYAAFRVGGALEAIWWPQKGDEEPEPEAGGGNG